MANVGSVELLLVLNKTQFNKDIASLTSLKIPALKLAPTIDLTAFKQQLKSLPTSLDDCIKVELCADTKGFSDKINRQLLGARPQIEVGLDLNTAYAQLEEFRASVSKQVSYLRLAAQYSAFRGEALPSTGSTKGQTTEQLKELIKETKNNHPKSGLLNSVKEGASYELGGSLFRQVRREVSKELGGDFIQSNIVKGISKSITVPAKILLDNEAIKVVIKDTGAILEKTFTNASYAVGDGLVAAIENEKEPLKAFLETTFDPGNLTKGIAEAKQEIIELVSAYKKAIEEIEVSSKFLEPVDKALRARRERALDDRAVPLVKQRSSEILADKKVKNTAKAIDADTKELFIAVSGYAGARGLAGARIARNLNKELPKNAKAIYVKNTDSDIPENTPDNKKLLAVGKSLAKPNLRGYSKDAVEVASQAYAAFQKNPEIKIKLIGESGGGYVAEEAARILQKMGLTNVEYKGIGTPNLIGRLDPESDKNKILSPDEYLGNATKKYFERVGIADTTGASQNVLGASGHNFEYYRGLAEVESFINKPRVTPTRGRVDDLKSLGASYAKTDFSKQSPEELKKLASKAFYDLQIVKKTLFAAEGDLKKELAEVVKVLQSVYIRAANEPPEIQELRESINRTNDFLDAAINLPIEQAVALAQSVSTELRSKQTEFSTTVGDERIGTLGAKFTSIETEVDQLVNTLTLPIGQLEAALKSRQGIKGKQPTLPPVLPPSIPSAASPLISELTAVRAKFSDTNVRAKSLEQANPAKAKAYAQATIDNLKRATLSVDKEIAKLTNEQKTGTLEGTQLSNLKSQLSRVENDSKDLLKRLEGAIIDPLASLESTIASSSIEGISIDEITQGYKAQIKALGNQFSAKSKLVSAGGGDAEEIAAEIARDLQVANVAIDKAIASLGNNADESLKKIARSARQKITVASKKSVYVPQIAPQSLQAVPTGVVQGIQANLQPVERVGVEIGQALTAGFEQEMEIKSPSRKMIREAGLIVQGLLSGVNAGLDDLFHAGVNSARTFGRGVESEPLPEIAEPSANLRTQISQLESFRATLDNIPNTLNEINPLLGRAYIGAVNLSKGFLLFQGAQIASSFINQFTRSSVDAIVTLDRLSTAITFASGGSKQGADNLKFVGEEVDRLRIPLGASQEGFAKLAAATKGSALAGQVTKDIFTGVSEASTVLGLTSDQTSHALLALTQVASKGTVSAEELRGQLAESGLAGAMGIAARAMGVTESQLNKLLETGQIMASDFLPKFGQQLKTEFGGAAEFASGNLQSALFNVENTNLKLQQSFGSLIAPAVTAGANALAAALEFINHHGKDLLISIATISFTIAGPLLKPMLVVIAKLPIMAALIIGLKQAFLNLRGAAKQLAIEFILIQGALALVETAFFFKDGGPLQKQFQGFTNAVDKATEKIIGLKKEIDKPPKRAVSNVLDYPINFINDRFREEIVNTPDKLLRKDKTRAQILKEFDEQRQLTSYADLDAKKTRENLQKNITGLNELSTSVGKKSAEVLFGQGEIGKLPNIDDQVRKISDQRKILEGRVTREFTNKGLNVPLPIKTEQLKLNEAFNKATSSRSVATKPYVEDLALFKQSIESAKATLKDLEDPETAAKFGGANEVEALRKSLLASIPAAEKARDTLESLLRSSKADPIIAFTDAFKLLNKQLAIASETTANKSLQAQLDLSKSSLKAFSKDVDASLKTAIADATIEKNRLASELKSLETDYKAKSKELDDPRFKPTLDRFNLKSTSSVATVQAAIDAPNTSEADKSLLAEIQSVAAAGVKVKEIRKQLLDSELKTKKVGEETALALIQRRYNKEVAVTKIAENQKTEAVKKELLARNITVEESSVRLSAIAVNSTKSEIKRTDNQLAQTRLLYSKGILSAEKFTEQERTLLVTQSELKKQLADEQLNSLEQIRIRNLAILAEVNNRAIALIDLQQAKADQGVSSKQLAIPLTEDSSRKAERDKAANQMAATRSRITQARKEISQLNAADFETAAKYNARKTELELGLTKLVTQGLDERLGLEKRNQEDAIRAIEKRVEVQKNAAELAVQSIEDEKTALSLLSSSIDRSKQLLESRNSINKALSDSLVITAEIALEQGNESQKQQLSINLQNVKLNALKQEQQTSRDLLDLDLKRQKLAAQMSVSEAEIAQSRALISRLDIVGELAKAEEQNDNRAIASATARLELQDKIVSSTDKQLENAQANLAIQDELAGNAQKTLSINQQAALAQAEAARVAAAKIKVEEKPAVDKPVSSGNNLGENTASTFGEKQKKVSAFEQSRLNMFAPLPTYKNVGLPPEYFNLKAVTHSVPTTSTGAGNSGMSAEAEQNAMLGINPGESTEDFLKRQMGLDPKMSAEAYDKLPKTLFYGQDRNGTLESLNKKYAPKANSLQQLQEMYKPKANSLGQLQEMYKTDAGSFEELNQKYAPKENTSAQFTDSLKMANKGIEDKLDKLNSSLLAATNSPRNLYVSSPEPISDAVSILADINRMNIQSSGLG